MTANPAVAVRLDEKGGLVEDIACRKCGYNLRGLRTEGVCPECGTAVGRSLYGDFLRYCDPAWVRTLAKGMNWILTGIVIGMLTNCVGGAGAGIASLRFGRLPDMVGWAIAMPGAIVAFVGYWMVTTRDPAFAGDEKQFSARRLVRIAQACGLVAAPILLLVRSASTVASIGLQIGNMIVGLVGTVALFVLAREFALRIPDEKLARGTRGLMWLVVALLGLGIGTALIGGVVTAASGGTAAGSAGGGGRSTLTRFSMTWGTNTTVVTTTQGGTSTTTMPAGFPASSGTMFGFVLFGIALAVLGLLCFIWGVTLFFRYRSAFLEQAATAERIWASTAASLPVARPSTGG